MKYKLVDKVFFSGGRMENNSKLMQADFIKFDTPPIVLGEKTF